MRLWTIQPVSALRDLKDSGVYRCIPERSYNLSKKNSLKPAYAWLIGKMEQRIGKRPEGVSCPVWAWHTWKFEHRGPDPDSAAFLRRSEEKVYLTLEITDRRVVLTDFDAWQSVMNGSYVSAAADGPSFERAERMLEELNGGELDREIRASWDNVFLTDPVDNEYLVRGKYIQATFWEIRSGDVVSAEILQPNL